MTFPAIADDLRRTVNEARGMLQPLSDDETSEHPRPGKWSKKEILGHLVDSATNNHQRFVRAALYGPLIFPGYEQDALAKLQRCNDVEWTLLLGLWESYNLYLAHVLAGLPESASSVPCTIGSSPTATLAYIAEDYVAHLKHHLNQIVGPRFVTAYGAKK
jgi:hypothetical protein